MFNLFEFFNDLFKPADSSLVGLKHLHRTVVIPKVVKPKSKKEIKISDLMKKTAVE